MKKIGLFILLGLAISGTSQANVLTGTNYQSPYCGCCGEWVKHLNENGITVTTEYSDKLSEIKQSVGLTPQLASCHTAKINGYAFEGHVPAADIKRFLSDPPKNSQGLTVPGMPIGSPGMEHNGQKDKYNVLSFDKSGKTTVFSTHNT
jgi:hypothetical protein